MFTGGQGVPPAGGKKAPPPLPKPKELKEERKEELIALLNDGKLGKKAFKKLLPEERQFLIAYMKDSVSQTEPEIVKVMLDAAKNVESIYGGGEDLKINPAMVEAAKSVYQPSGPQASTAKQNELKPIQSQGIAQIFADKPKAEAPNVELTGQHPKSKVGQKKEEAKPPVKVAGKKKAAPKAKPKPAAEPTATKDAPKAEKK